MADIDDKTKIPLFVVLGAIGAILAFLIPVFVWIGTVSAKADNDSLRVDRVVDKIHRMEDLDQSRYNGIMGILTEVRDRTIRIEQHQLDMEK